MSTEYRLKLLVRGGVSADWPGQNAAPRVGLEPTTNGLTVHCSEVVYLGKRMILAPLGHAWATARFSRRSGSAQLFGCRLPGKSFDSCPS